MSRKYAAFLREQGMDCHPLLWSGAEGGCSHPDHHPVALALTQGDANIIEHALRTVLLHGLAGDALARERMKDTLRRVEAQAIVKGEG